jgi:hypothetical protein
MEDRDRDKWDDEIGESEGGSENLNSEPGRSSGSGDMQGGPGRSSDLESDLGSEDIGESEDVELESWAREH